LVLDSWKILGKKFWACVEKTHNNLGTLEQQANYGDPVSPLGRRRKDCSSCEGLWAHFQEAADRVKYPSLLWFFRLHCKALPLIPLRNRAIGSQRCNLSLGAHLRKEFLPQIFSLIDTYLSEWNLDIDLDGNIFIALLGISLSDAALSSSKRAGGPLSRIAIEIASPQGDPAHLEILEPVFPLQVSRSQPRPSAAAPKKLLPFHHDVFDEGFSLINLSSDSLGETPEYGALEFGRDTAFSDKYHWHNAKRHILPKHLGGEQEKPNDEWQRMKMMKAHQRFMSRLTANAATLTGALGARFNRLTIVTTRTDEAQGKNAVRFALDLVFP
jgi:hypothetical protein